MIEQIFPIWNQLSIDEQNTLQTHAKFRKIPAGTLLHSGMNDCLGLLLVQSGQLRAYITSDSGKEITIYRLFEHDICLFSASCIMKNIQFDVCIEAASDAEIFIIPSADYQSLMNTSMAVLNYTNQLMASRFSDVMWLLDQILWKSFDKRLAQFLLDERSIDDSDTLHITHEQIAAHMGSAREVVTRMLKHFQSEGLVTLSRGLVSLTDIPKLIKLSE